MSLIESLKWRYATKKYNSEKAISETDLAFIRESIQLTPTSYGLQLFKIIEVENAELKDKLVPASWGQTQANTASNYMVFCVPNKITPETIDEFIAIKAKDSGVDTDQLSGYGDFIKAQKLGLSDEENQIWMAKQAYIGLGLAMVAAAELKVDSTPMEGFDAMAYSDILGLTEKGLIPVVVLALGFRSEEDETQGAPKSRRQIADLFETI